MTEAEIQALLDDSVEIVFDADDNTIEIDAYLSDVVKMQSLSGFYLSGIITGDRQKRFPEGVRVHTTKIIKKITEDVVRTKSGTVYRIRNWLPDPRS